MTEIIKPEYVLASVVYSFLGVIILGISFYVFEKITPEDIRKEILQKNNTAIAIVSGAFIIAIAIIVASAIH
jgi:putative membrane protein